MKRHIDHNPVLLHGFWTVWKVLSQMGWQMRTEDGQQVYEFVCSDPIPGIHRFFSPETLLQYIGTFPYPLQEFDILAQTLQRHKWQIDDDSMELEFYHPIDGSKYVTITPSSTIKLLTCLLIFTLFLDYQLETFRNFSFTIHSYSFTRTSNRPTMSIQLNNGNDGSSMLSQ